MKIFYRTSVALCAFLAIALLTSGTVAAENTIEIGSINEISELDAPYEPIASTEFNLVEMPIA